MVREVRGHTFRVFVVCLPAWSRALTEIVSVRLSLSAHVTCPNMSMHAAWQHSKHPATSIPTATFCAGPCIFKPACQARGARIPVPVENEPWTLQTYAAMQPCKNLCHTNGTPSAYFALLLNSVTDEFCGDFGSDFSRKNGALLKNQALKVSSLDLSVGCCCSNPIWKCST